MRFNQFARVLLATIGPLFLQEIDRFLERSLGESPEK